ncbi:hypothetical protein SLEP1_g10640 [Rubroshorea leprosula]|uniref:Proline dehydrogenase n=1 Tax=Rubroshorea leprosula TaxID=152421 RepID=A0AAV5II11_9ROSI|nr:hypothetical protein SLEP1_g10640 [Rubroshorea leprosula]
MATRVLQSPKIIQKFRYFTRTLNSSASASPPISDASPLNIDGKPIPIIETEPVTTTPTPTIDLHDHRKLFASLPTFKLLRSAANLHLAAIEPVVDFGMWVMNSRLMETGVVRDVVLSTIKHTFFEHFCAGETEEEVETCVRRINEAGLEGILDYAVEHTSDNAGCDRNLQGFLGTVQLAKSLPPSPASSIAVKITAITPISLLKRISDLLRWQYKDPSFNLPWKLNCFPIFSESSPLYHTLERPEPLTPEEEQDFELAQQRLLKICQECAEAGIPLMIDAEDTYLQPSIDYFTYSTAINHNRDDNPVVYGTIQAYLKDAKERLLLVTKDADKQGVPMGFKLVRGAYMTSERKLASSLGFEYPIHNSIQETHDCYNSCAAFLLERIADGNGGVILATHNVESGQLAATKARNLGIGKGNHKLEFAQLYGMSDSLSYGLSNAGFRVGKYLPYGPVDKVIPYLLRRAEENRGMLSTSTLDRQLMSKELKRRLKNLIFSVA